MKVELQTDHENLSRFEVRGKWETTDRFGTKVTREVNLGVVEHSAEGVNSAFWLWRGYPHGRPGQTTCAFKLDIALRELIAIWREDRDAD